MDGMLDRRVHAGTAEGLSLESRVTAQAGTTRVGRAEIRLSEAGLNGMTAVYILVPASAVNALRSQRSALWSKETMAKNFHEHFERPELPLPPDRSTGLVFTAVALIVAYFWRTDPKRPQVALAIAGGAGAGEPHRAGPAAAAQRGLDAVCAALEQGHEPDRDAACCSWSPSYRPA